MSNLSVVIQTMAINDQKAGMQSLDKDRVNRIIHEMSKGSNFFQHQQQRQERINKRAKDMERSLLDFSDIQRQKAKREIDELAYELEESRDLTKLIVHIDMDAFYAAVEMRDDPSLHDKPVAVGGLHMLSTSNYRARTFGVRAAMPGFIAKKLCPDLIIVQPNFDKYATISKQVLSVLKEYSTEVSMVSLDEGYLDITEYVSKRANILHGVNSEYNPVSLADEVVREMRDKIFVTTNLTASAGIAPNMMLAKVCSDRNKPNGQFRLYSDLVSIKKFVADLPLRKISGIGPVQDQLFANLGIVTCRDLWTKREIIPLLFTRCFVDFYVRVAMGLGTTCIKQDCIRKSIGIEESFREINEPERLLDKCRELCHDLSEDLAQREIEANVVILKMKNVKFCVMTRNYTLGCHTSDEKTIFGTCKRLLEKEIAAAGPSGLRLRLMGVRLQGLLETGKCSVARQKLLNFEKGSASQTETSVVCPICAHDLSKVDSLEINKHVDDCLSRKAIKEMLSVEEAPHTTKRKNSNDDRRKCKPKKCRTDFKPIESYFYRPPAVVCCSQGTDKAHH